MIYGRQKIKMLLTDAGHSNPQTFHFAIALLTGLFLMGLLSVLRRVVPSIASTVRYLWAATPGASYDAFEPKDRITAENDLRANQIQVITAAVQALGGIAVLIGIYFAWANLRTTQEAQKDSQNNETKTLKITNEGQITERFTKAIDQLGALDAQGKALLEIRLGGIYALEQIAWDSDKDYWPIMEVLTAYIRDNVPLTMRSSNPQALACNTANGISLEPSEPNYKAPVARRADINAILTVIGRRKRTWQNGEETRLDLRNTNLEGADLHQAHLEGAELTSAHLEHADLVGAHLRLADLRRACLNGAQLNGAQLNGADLRGADLRGADLQAIPSFRISDAVGLSQEQLKSIRGDKDTELPHTLVMPKSWKQEAGTPNSAQPKSS